MPTTRLSPASHLEPLEARIAPAAVLYDLGTLAAADGFKIDGVALNDGAGVAVSPAGDVNGDTLDDFILGARGADPNGDLSGASYVVFGKVGGFGASFDLTTLNGTNGFKISGEEAGDYAGSAVSRAGDVDGDGFDDLLVGAFLQDPAGVTGAGAAYVIYGKATAFDANVQLSSAGITRIAGEDGADRFGLAVAAAGDVNDDGKADLIFGAPSAGPAGSDQPGRAYVIFGKTGGLGASVNLATLDGTDGFQIRGEADGDYAGRSVSGAGDINGDGFDDVIVGAYGADVNGNDEAGAAYVIFGKMTGFTATLALSGLDEADGFKINGEAADDYAGWSVSGAGDVNGDGFADLLIGAELATRNLHTQGGAAYVVFGKAASFGTSFNLSSLNGANGFKIPGHEDTAKLGSIVGAAGDLNGDGFADIVLGADRAKPGNITDAGSAYVIFGKASGFTTNFDLATLDGAKGFRINGAAIGDRAGFAVSAAGDLNGDGLGDLLVGAPDLAGTAGPGTAFVIFGTRPPIEFSKNFRTATFADVDGDIITVKVNKGALSEADFEVAATGQFLRLNLADDGQEFAGTTIKITAKKARGGAGDGKVNVGAIDAAGIDLGAVSVSGDLGQLDAGDPNPLTPGVARLTVGSLGVAANTQPGGTLDPLHSEIDGKLGGLKVAGGVKGVVDVDGALGAVSIGGDLDGSAAGALAGLLRATGDLGAVTVKGSILGGADLAGIVAGAKLGRISVTGNLSSADAAKPVQLSAPGKLGGTKAADHLAIAGLTVKGNVLNAQILAGYDALGAAVNRDASIGAVSVTGTWSASDLVAGVADAPVDGFGQNDAAIAGGLADLVAKIASVTIKGAVSGAAGGGHFGLTAEQIGSAKITGVKQLLTKGTDPAISLDPTNNNFRLVEV